MGGLSGLRAIAAAGAMLLAPAAMAADAYIFDIAKRDRQIMPAWRKVVPKDYAGAKWIWRFEGVTIPVERVAFNGKDFYAGSVCAPHMCASDVVVFMIAVDHSEAYGLLKSDIYAVEARTFGAPGPDALKYMQGYLR